MFTRPGCCAGGIKLYRTLQRISKAGNLVELGSCFRNNEHDYCTDTVHKSSLSLQYSGRCRVFHTTDSKESELVPDNTMKV